MKKFLTYGIVIAVIGVVGYFLWKRSKTGSFTAALTGAPPAAPAPSKEVSAAAGESRRKKRSWRSRIGGYVKGVGGRALKAGGRAALASTGFGIASAALG